jgi:predicted DNA-binding protein
VDKDKQTTLRLPERLLTALEVEARRNGRTTAGEIRWALMKHVGQLPDAPQSAKQATKRRKTPWTKRCRSLKSDNGQRAVLINPIFGSESCRGSRVELQAMRAIAAETARGWRADGVILALVLWAYLWTDRGAEFCSVAISIT